MTRTTPRAGGRFAFRDNTQRRADIVTAPLPERYIPSREHGGSTVSIIQGMNHFNVLSDKLDATVEFYCDLLGLTPGPRPPLSFPGAWLYAGGQPILHVSAGRALPDDPAGVIDHIAFTASGLASAVAKLKARGVPFEVRRQVTTRIWQVFCHDPCSATVELDFDPAEPAPEGDS